MPKIRPAPGYNTTQELFEQEDENTPPISAVEDSSGAIVKEERVTPKVEDESTDALRKQVAELRKSEQIQRDLATQAARDRAEAIKRANERDTELSRLRKETTQSRQEAIASALAAAQAEADKAQQDYETAASIGDFKAMSEANRRISKADASIVSLEGGKSAIEEKIKEEESVPKIDTRADDVIEASSLPDTAKEWLRAHPEFMSDPRKNARIQSLHYDVLDEGHKPFSPAYYESLEVHLGLRKNQSQAPDLEEEDDSEPVRQQEQRRSSIVSAPVTREVPSGNGSRSSEKPRLTQEQRDIAKNAGITEVEYARQLMRLRKEKQSGSYGGQP